MPLYSVLQLADALGVHPETVYRLTRRGLLPHLRIGRQLRFDLAEVRVALRHGEVTP